MSCCANKDNSCLNKMSDGRHFTDYRPRCIINQSLIDDVVNNNITGSSYDTRMYLQHNAEKIMEKQNASNYVNMRSSCTPCDGVSTILPEQYVVKCDTVTCKRVKSTPNGLGDGRNYE